MDYDLVKSESYFLDIESLRGFYEYFVVLFSF